jgi:hypothetical protein
MNRNKHKNYVLQNLSSEHIILKFYYKIFKCFYLIKNSIFYEIIITVFQYTHRAFENRSAHHAWHACLTYELDISVTHCTFKILSPVVTVGTTGL